MITSVITEVERVVASALKRNFGSLGSIDPQVRASTFADFQSNSALGLARQLGRPPREIADLVAADISRAEAIRLAEVSGPGYVNVWIDEIWLEGRLQRLARDSGLEQALDAQTVVIDYSSPNVAKAMHIGHLRTTIVGDALARVHERSGDRVIRQNHVGDWGTPFGMIIEHILEGGDSVSLEDSDSLSALYKDARARFDDDPDFADRSRQRVVRLQAEEQETVAVWSHLVDASKRYFSEIYAQLNVSLGDADIAGESSYRHELPEIVDALTSSGLASDSEGALCTFPEGFLSRTGAPQPLIIRKGDGGFTYATTDLAAVRRRAIELRANRILYVVGAPQAMHFAMVFATARAIGWLPGNVEADHVQIGNVLGADGKILRTRSGDTPSLSSVMNEAIASARRTLLEAGRGGEEIDADARAIGIGALKFADLITHHDAEYTFDIDRMLHPQGRTGPYVQYAAVRLRSLAEASLHAPDESAGILLREAEERSLALTLLEYPRVIAEVRQQSAPHLLAEHLVNLAQGFNAFYDRCPVLRAPSSELRASRLLLSQRVLDQLVDGLNLLGIDLPGSM